jgi:hypothetical protein
MPDSVSPHGSTEPPEGDSSNIDGSRPRQELAPRNVTIELVEIAPNVVAVLGSLPKELEVILEPLNPGLMSVLDRQDVSNALASVGSAAALGGNIAQAAQSMQGLYYMADESQALLRAGGRLAVKDGKNLATIIPLKGSGNTFAQARFTPAAGLSVAQFAAAAGPALAMMALQAQLNEVGTLVRKNIELTTLIIENTRRQERAQLDGLIATIDQALQQARAAGAVPSSLWETIAPKGTDLRTERNKYLANTAAHIKKVRNTDVRLRRDYMQANAEAIAHHAFALLSTLKAWIGYQGLAAAVARRRGETDPVEATHFASIVEATKRDWETDLATITDIVAMLARELRIVTELRGPTTLKFSPKRKDVDATRSIAHGLLEAIAPLAGALIPARDPLEVPPVLCAPAEADMDPYLGLLRWLLDPDEELQALAFGDNDPSRGKVGAVVDAAKGRVASTFDKDPAELMVTVTDRRILATNPNTLLRRGLFDHEIKVSDVRYVRVVPSDASANQSRVDLITRERNHDWYFGPDVSPDDVKALASVLAQSMALPDDERQALLSGTPALTTTQPLELTE